MVSAPVGVCVDVYFPPLNLRLMQAHLSFCVLCVCGAAAAVSEARRLVPHHSQHADERPKLPLTRNLQHPPLSNESLSTAANGEKDTMII